jgi:diacylglycerol kinase family enzyme
MEITAAIDPQKTCAVLCIGGDGTVHEALNGLAGAGLLGKIPVGVVCGGSGNGLATSLGHEDPRVAVLSLLQGE